MTLDTAIQDLACGGETFKERVPLISILIPSFEDLSGVFRILDKIPNALVVEGVIEVLLSDDSPNFCVGKSVLDEKSYSFVKVMTGPRRGGAANWNHLITESNGRFIQFIHHDECPQGPSFFEDLVTICGSTIGIYHHACIRKGRFGYFRHCQPFLRTLAIRQVPHYYMHRNIFGSPSNFCVPRQDLVFFDETLIYYVDVDWYSRFSEDYEWIPSGLSMISFENSASITNNLRKSGLKLIEDKEAFRLQALKPRYSISVLCLDLLFYFQKVYSFLGGFMNHLYKIKRIHKK